MYLLDAQFAVALGEIFPQVLNVDTAAVLSLIFEIVLTAEIRNRIEPSSGFILRCASKTLVKPVGRLGLYLRLNNLIVTFYFGVMQIFQPNRLV